MRQFAKFVAGLFVVVMAIPALAVVPCRDAMHSVTCCSSDCPMMATDSGARIASSGPGVTMPVCCNPSSQRAMAFIDQRTTDNPIEQVVLHNRAASPHVVVFVKNERLHRREGQALNRLSRIVLCTFLI